MINVKNLKKKIIETPKFYEGVISNKKDELNFLIEENIQKTLEEINAKKLSFPKWEKIKAEKIRQAHIEMMKIANSLNILDKNKVIEKLIQYVKNIPFFFDFSRDYTKKEELLNEIEIIARKIAKEYIQRKNEEIRYKRESEENYENLRRKFEKEELRRKEAEEEIKKQKRKISEEKKRRREYEYEESENDDEIEKYESESDDEKEDSEELVEMVINGYFGDGEERKKNLGKRFAHIQNKVNERLGYDKRYKEI